MKKNILFVSSISLKDPIRGTPIRIHGFLQQIKREHNLTICAYDISPDLASDFVSYPKLSWWGKFQFFRQLVRDKNIDIVMTAAETNIKLPLLLKFFCKTKAVIDIHGLYFEELYYQGYLPRWKKIINEKSVNFYLRFYDLIFVVSDKLRSYYLPLNKNIEYIYGGVYLKDFSPQHQVPEVFTIGYMGNSRSYQGLSQLLTCAKNIKDKKICDFKLNLIISGEKESVQKMIDECGLRDCTEVHFDVAHQMVNGIICRSSVLVIPRPSVKMTEYAYPSKLPENLTTGIPLIISAVGPVDELLHDQDFCVIIDPQKLVPELEKALIAVQNLNLAQRQAMGERAIAFVKNNLLWDMLGDKINHCLQKL